MRPGRTLNLDDPAVAAALEAAIAGLRPDRVVSRTGKRAQIIRFPRRGAALLQLNIWQDPASAVRVRAGGDETVPTVIRAPPQPPASYSTAAAT